MSAKTFEEWKKGYYVEHGFISSEKEMEAAWNASRASLLADAPDVERLVLELRMNYSYFVTEDTSACGSIELFSIAAAALLAQQARIKELEGELAQARAERDALREDAGPFPMQGGPPIPLSLAKIIYAGYSALSGTDQSLERLAERGGFGWAEVSVIYKHPKARAAIDREGKK